MNYTDHYNRLIIRARDRKIDEYTERHHIVPRCMNGKDDNENIVRLTPREHYTAHLLLAKIFPNIHGLIKACHIMTVDKNGLRISNREYAWVKKAYSEVMRANMLGSTKDNNPTVMKISITLTGRSAKTHQHIADRADKIRGINHPCYGQNKQTNESVARSAEKRNKFSVEIRKLIFTLYDAKKTYNEIISVLKNQNIIIGYSTLRSMCRRYKLEQER